MDPSFNLQQLVVKPSTENLVKSDLFKSSLEDSQKYPTIDKKESHHRHPKVCLSLCPETSSNKSKVLSYRPQEKPPILDTSDNYRYYPKPKVVFEPKDLQEHSKDKSQVMIQSVIQRKEAIKMVEESHTNGRNKWGSRGNSQNNSFQHGSTSRQSSEYQRKNQVVSFGLADSQIYPSKPSVSLALKNGSLLESKIQANFEGLSHVLTIQDSKIMEKDSSASIMAKKKEPYKNYLDSIITENDKLIERIAKRLQTKELSKVVQKAPACGNSSYLRSSFLRPSGSKTNRVDSTIAREKAKHKPASSFTFEQVNTSAHQYKSDSRNRWLDSKSVDVPYGAAKPVSQFRNLETSSAVQPQTVNSLQQRRALAKFLNKIK